MRILANIIISFSALLLITSANAGAIYGDPGNVGSSVTELTFNMGTRTAEDMSMLFDNGKYIELAPQVTEFAQIQWGSHHLFGNFWADMEFGFLDKLGNKILSSGPFNGLIASSYHNRLLDVQSSLDIYGIFFNMSSHGLISENARIKVSLDGIVKAHSVPEPSSLALLLLGMLGIGLSRTKIS